LVKGDVQRLYDRRALYFNRKAASLGVRGWITPAEMAAMPLFCFYCKKPLDHRRSEFDHQVPFSRGGWNTVDNIVRCCKKCNGEKFSKTPEEWAVFQAQEFNCKACGRTFRPRYSDWMQGNGLVCSRSCAAKWRFMK
jgi:5-methylcytosine-specific restriction endonuclease McrA